MTIDDPSALAGDGTAPVPAWSVGALHKRLLEVAAAGALAALLLVLFWLQPRPDFWVAIGQPFFWIKGLYTVALAAIALGGTLAATRPERASWPILAMGAAVVGAIALAAGLEARGLDAALRAHIFKPSGAINCLFCIGLLSVPMLLAVGVGLRGVELERPGLAGLAAGVFCGAVAASVFGLHCQDSTFLFVALWYTLAVALCGVVGAAGLKLINRCAPPDPISLSRSAP